MGGFGRLADELGDGGEFEAGSCPGWLESDWKHWPGSLSENGADLRLDSAPRRWVASAVALTRLASSSSCMTLTRSSILILTFSLASAAVSESM